MSHNLLDHIEHGYFGDLDYFCENVNISIVTHPKHPLAVLAYDTERSAKNDAIINQCKGIVVEWAHDESDNIRRATRIVARGLDRFFHHNDSSNVLPLAESKIKAQVKEDGSRAVLFHYGGAWLLSTRHGFATEELTYGVSVEQLVLDTLHIDSLQQIGAHLSPTVSYCIEVCTPRNAIVKVYRYPAIFLVAARDLSADGHPELSVDVCDRVASAVGMRRPERLSFNSVAEARVKLDECVRADPTFEGFVLTQDVSSAAADRVKLKPWLYGVLHELKFRGWIRATPSLVVPLIFAGESGMAHMVMSLMRDQYGKREHEMLEYRRTFETQKQMLQDMKSELDIILSTSGIASEVTVRPRAEYVKMIRAAMSKSVRFKNLSRRFEGFLFSMYAHLGAANAQATLDLVWARSMSWCIATLEFWIEERRKQARAHTCHETQPCCESDANDGMARQKDDNELDAERTLTCYCGKTMHVKRLRDDFIIRRTCMRCGIDLETVKIYPSKTILWLCEDTHCGLSMEAASDGNPRGIPASRACRNLRFLFHDAVTSASQRLKCDKSDIYGRVQNALGLSAIQTHASKMGMRNLTISIDLLKRMV